MRSTWTRHTLAATVIGIVWACSSSEERTFVPDDAGADSSAGTSGSGSGGDGGSAGASGGSAGVGGTAGTTGGVGGTAGTSTAGAGGDDAGPDAPATCTGDGECDDGEACNGEEKCTSGKCAPGTNLADDSPCTFVAPDAGAGDAAADADVDADVDGSVVDAGAVEYSCFGGECLFRCAADGECHDGNLCTGTEICASSSRTCQTGTPLDCSDSDLCTDDLCIPETGCSNPLIDGDNDGHAATLLGECGDDCDDADETIFAGAGELCDLKNNDCDSETDEEAPIWYVDCDADGFAPLNAVSMQQCTKPPAHVSCVGGGGDWTATAPADQASTDCWDAEPLAYPAASPGWQTEAISGAPQSKDFDYDCNTVEEKRYPTGNVSTGSSCAYVGSPYSVCTGATGWTGSVPACGDPGQYTYCHSALGCQRFTTSNKLQECK